jgi:hypothetical protein
MPIRRYSRLVGRLVLALAGLCHLTSAAALAEDRADRLPRIAIDEPVSDPPASELQLRASDLPVPVLARVTASLESDAKALDARLAQHASRKVPVWLAITAPSAVDAVESWQALLQGVLSRHGSSIAIVEIDVNPSDAKLAAYVLRQAATDIRSEREAIRVAVGGATAARAADVYTVDLAPYLDLLVLPEGADISGPEALLHRVDPGAQIAITGLDVGATADQAVRRMIDSELETLGTDVTLHSWRSSERLVPALRALTPLATLMGDDVSVLDTAAANLKLSKSDRDVTSSVPHRLLFDGRTFATYLAYWGDSSTDLLELSLTLPTEGRPAVHRLMDGATVQASDYSRVADTGLTRARVPLSAGPMLVNFSEGASEVFVDRSEVAAERHLTVEEIIARHQQQQRTQDALVRSYIATARMDQHFRPTMTDPGYDVASDNRYFVSGSDVEWEELSFSVNGTKWGPDRPAFPLLQAEKVLSLPLQLRFDNDYRYRLAGTERVGEYDCYVVRFDPVGQGRSLYRGTVWIERRTFPGRLQRRDSDLRAGDVDRQPARVPVHGSHRAPDHPHCGPQSARREERRVLRLPRESRRFRGIAR